MRLPSFEFVEAHTVDDACCQIAAAAPAAAVLAGGTDLLVKMKRGKVVPRRVVSIARLRGAGPAVSASGPTVMIHPLATMAELARDPLLLASHGNIAAGAGRVGSPLVRNRATVGGNLASARPCADTAPPLLTWDAYLRLTSTGGERTITLVDFLAGPGQTALWPGELITGIEFAAAQGKTGSAFLKLGVRAALEITIASAAVRLTLDRPGGVIRTARIALGSVAPVPLRARAAEDLLAGKRPGTDLFARAAAVAAREARPIDDLRGSAAYRRQIVELFVRRALTAAADEAGGDR